MSGNQWPNTVLSTSVDVGRKTRYSDWREESDEFKYEDRRLGEESSRVEEMGMSGSS